MEKKKLKMYRPFKWTETCVNDMNVKDWEQYRKEGPHGELTSTIGGSDIGTILGTNKYKTMRWIRAIRKSFKEDIFLRKQLPDAWNLIFGKNLAKKM